MFEKTAVEAQVLVSEFFVNALGAVVVDKPASDGGADGVGLTHATVGGDGDVSLAQSVHGVGDDRGSIDLRRARDGCRFQWLGTHERVPCLL